MSRIPDCWEETFRNLTRDTLRIITAIEEREIFIQLIEQIILKGYCPTLEREIDGYVSMVHQDSAHDLISWKAPMVRLYSDKEFEDRFMEFGMNAERYKYDLLTKLAKLRSECSS